MQIYVNNTELEAQLTDEQNLLQVYDAVSDWTRANHRYILGIQVDQKIMAPDHLEEINTASVDRVDFRIGDEIEMMAESVAAMDRYIDRNGNSLFDRTHLTAEEIQNLKDGVRWISEIIASSCAIMHLNSDEIMCPVVGEDGAETKTVHELLAALATSAEELKTDGPDSVLVFLSILRDLRFFVIKLKMQLLALNATEAELVSSLEEFESRIPVLMEELVQVTTQFQSGQDFQALESLDAVVEKLNTYLSAMLAVEYRLARDGSLPAQKGGEGMTFQQVSEDLTGILKDISSAMVDSDIVAVGDILEYELTARLSQMPPFLKQLREILVARS